MLKGKKVGFIEVSLLKALERLFLSEGTPCPFGDKDGCVAVKNVSEVHRIFVCVSLK